jgi:hypothetical protein
MAVPFSFVLKRPYPLFGDVVANFCISAGVVYYLFGNPDKVSYYILVSKHLQRKMDRDA